MIYRAPFAVLLSLTCLAPAGCGNTPSLPNAEAKAEPLSEAQVAAARAPMDQAAEEERGYQQQYPVGKKAGRAR